MIYPKEISWIIDTACNLHCPHCYVSSTNKSTSSLSHAEIKKECNNMASIQPEQIVISGGEPLLNKNLFCYLEEARKIASGHLVICTNGVVVTREKLLQIKKTGVNGFFVSLDHPNEAINDHIRGIGSTKKIIDSLAMIQDAGFGLGLDMTLMKTNVSGIEKYFDFAMKHNINNICFVRFKPIGRGVEHKNKFNLNGEEYRQVLKRILSMSIKHEAKISANVHDPLYKLLIYQELVDAEKSSDNGRKNGSYIEALRRQLELAGKIGFCRAGTQWIGVGPNGDVSPCPKLLYTGVSIGNVLTNNLREIIDNSKLIGSIQQRRSCRSACKYMNLCGCCLVHSNSAKRDMFEKDPMCWN